MAAHIICGRPLLYLLCDVYIVEIILKTNFVDAHPALATNRINAVNEKIYAA